MALTKVGFISIPRGEQRGFDHADVYRHEAPTASRLYVAHTGADRIEVIDCLSNSYLHFLPDVPGVAGILIDNEHDLLFSSDRGCARVSIYRCSDETLLGRVPVGDRPNGLAYDSARRRLFVFNIGDPPGVNCTVSVVAVDEMQVIATIPLPGRPRWAVYDAVTEHIYASSNRRAQCEGPQDRTGFQRPNCWATWHGDFRRASFLCGRRRGIDCSAPRHGSAAREHRITWRARCNHARSGIGTVVRGDRIARGD